MHKQMQLPSVAHCAICAKLLCDDPINTHTHCTTAATIVASLATAIAAAAAVTASTVANTASVVVTTIDATTTTADIVIGPS
jgi:hypothetical protein